jgi:PPOX class probable F420-dependent enzyme
MQTLNAGVLYFALVFGAGVVLGQMRVFRAFPHLGERTAELKVKRIRNNPHVRIVPCDLRGNRKGEWVDSTARILDEHGAARGYQLLYQQYGLIKRIGNVDSRLRRGQSVVIAIDPV